MTDTLLRLIAAAATIGFRLEAEHVNADAFEAFWELSFDGVPNAITQNRDTQVGKDRVPSILDVGIAGKHERVSPILARVGINQPDLRIHGDHLRRNLLGWDNASALEFALQVAQKGWLRGGELPSHEQQLLKPAIVEGRNGHRAVLHPCFFFP